MSQRKKAKPKPKPTPPAARQPGQRPAAFEREDLLARVERALTGGAQSPADVLAAVPALGTWDTAASYIDQVRAKWSRQAEVADLSEARGRMIAGVRMARAKALCALDTAESASQVIRLSREVERLVRCEAWLLGIESEGKSTRGKRRPPEPNPQPKPESKPTPPAVQPPGTLLNRSPRPIPGDLLKAADPFNGIPEKIKQLAAQIESEPSEPRRAALAAEATTLKNELLALCSERRSKNGDFPSTARIGGEKLQPNTGTAG